MFEVLHFLHLQDFITSSESNLPTSQMLLGFKVFKVVEVVHDLRTLVVALALAILLWSVHIDERPTDDQTLKN